MNNTNEPVGIGKGLSTLERPKFGPGMLLQHEDLEQLNVYTRSLSRLLFQSFFGCGVICGLVVEAVELVDECQKLKVTVQPGVALTCAGDPVYVPGPTTVYTKGNFRQDVSKEVWVKLCATVKCCAPRTTSCSSDDDEVTSECTREIDAFEIQLVKDRPKCACACPEDDPHHTDDTHDDDDADQNDCLCADIKCHKNHYDGICGCTCGDCSACDCKCVLLARLQWDDQKNKWLVDHSARRFIRPVLMRDPQLEKDKAARTADTGDTKPGPATGKEAPSGTDAPTGTEASTGAGAASAAKKTDTAKTDKKKT